MVPGIYDCFNRTAVEVIYKVFAVYFLKKKKTVNEQKAPFMCFKQRVVTHSVMISPIGRILNKRIPFEVKKVNLHLFLPTKKTLQGNENT